MTSRYRQPSALPWSALTLSPAGTPLSDSFANTGPQLVAANGAPVYGYAELGPLWTPYESHSGVSLARPAVNVNLGAAEMLLQSDITAERAAWIELALPPLVVGKPQSFTIYGRSFVGAVNAPIGFNGSISQSQPWAWAACGIYISAGTLKTGFGYAVGQEVGWINATTPYMKTAAYGIHNSNLLGNPYVSISGAGINYYRIRFTQTRVGTGVPADKLDFLYGIDVSSNGLDWMNYDTFGANNDPIAYAYTHAGFWVSLMPMSSRAFSASALLDFFRIENNTFSDGSTRIGGQQHLGAV